MPDTTFAFDQPFETEKEEGSSFSVMPSGKYEVEVVDATVSRTKSGKGTMLNVSLQVTQEGDYLARYLFAHVLFQHESAEAQRIGRQKIKDLCVACGITEDITDVTVFLNHKLLVQVGIESDPEENYPDRNKVTRFLPLPKPVENTFHSDSIPF